MIISKLTSAYRTATDRGIVVMLQAAGRLALATLQKLCGKRYLERPVHSYRMLLDTKDQGLSRSLILFRTREVDHKVMLDRIVQPGMTIFDIGGNIGYYPLMELKLLAGTGKLIVVEPSVHNVALLKRNLLLNGYGDVPVLQAAVSNATGQRKFHLSAQSNLGTFHPTGSGSETLTGETIDVETLTVPELVRRFGAPDLLRMDVEGHEVEILDGMIDDIRKQAYAPTVIFETHLSRYTSDHNIIATLEALFSLGYTVPLVSSSSDRAAERLKRLGYAPMDRIATDGIHRTLFADIKPQDAIETIGRTGGFRTVVIGKGHAVRPN